MERCKGDFYVFCAKPTFLKAELYVFRMGNVWFRFGKRRMWQSVCEFM